MQKPQVISTSTADVILRKMMHPPTGESRKADFGEVGQLLLASMFCPYCETDDVEGFLFGGEDNREGGLLDCGHCGVAIAWIDSPFEAEEMWYDDRETDS